MMDNTYKLLNSILIKPAGPDCNMDCEYCFYLDKSDLFPESRIHRMSDPILETMIQQMMGSGLSHLSFGWQGGEPTLMGIPFFERAVLLQKRYGSGQHVGNGLQTNGVLIDADWAQFLKNYNFLVGLSLDGPQHVHDRYRRMHGGGGTWERVTRSARLLLEYEVAVNALIVVNDYSVHFPSEIYHFQQDLGLDYMQFIPCVERDRNNPTVPAPFTVLPERYGEFLCQLFELWLADFKDAKPTTSIRFFDALFYRYVDMQPPDCTLWRECGIYVVVEHNGDVYSCDFYVEPEWRLGNVMENNLVDMLNSERQRQFGRMKSDLPRECQFCQWLTLCMGGCTKERIRVDEPSHLCQAYRMFYEHANPQLKRLAENWKRQQQIERQKRSVLQATGQGGMNVKRNDPCPCGSGLKYKRCCGASV